MEQDDASSIRLCRCKFSNLNKMCSTQIQMYVGKLKQFLTNFKLKSQSAELEIIKDQTQI